MQARERKAERYKWRVRIHIRTCLRSYKDFWDMLEISVIVLRVRVIDQLLTHPENLIIIWPGDNAVVFKSDPNDQ